MYRAGSSDPRSVWQFLIHIESRCTACRTPHHLGRNPGYGGTGRHILQHDTAGGNFRTCTDIDSAQQLGAGSDQYTLGDTWMPVSPITSPVA